MKVGFIGLGNMGKPIATNELNAGFDLMAFDARSEPLDELRKLGARIATSPREIGEFAEVIGLSLRDDAQLEAVILGSDGVLEGAQAGSVIAIHTTCHPATVLRIAEAATRKGVGVLDAPVSNGAVGAASAELCFMVGGEETLLTRCRPVFAASAAQIFHVGALGRGVMTKLAHQVICIGTVNAVAEGMLLAEASGVDLQAFDEVLRHSSARSHFTDTWVSRFRDRKPAVAAVMRDSIDPALQLGRELGVPLLLAALAQQLHPSRIPAQHRLHPNATEPTARS